MAIYRDNKHKKECDGLSHSKNNHVALTKLQYHSRIEKEADSKKAKHANKKQEIKEREVFSPGNLNYLSGTQISRSSHNNSFFVFKLITNITLYYL